MAGVAALGAGLAPRLALAQGDEEVLTEALVLRDPDIPVAGNPDGDITIVEYFDYNCPYCRKIAPEIRQVVQDDGKVRLVLKDWPILGEVSVIASRMALACKYQDKFVQAHDALIGVSSKLTEPRIGELLAGAGIDVDRAKRDLATNAKAIDADHRAQRRSGRGVRLQGHAVLHRRQIPRAGHPDHGAVRSGDRRRAQGGGEQIAAANSKSALVGDEGALALQFETLARLLRRQLDPVVMGAPLQRVPVGGRDVPVHDGAIGRCRPDRWRPSRSTCES